MITESRSPRQSGHAVSKVAQITLLFWVTKICATTLGETAGDLLSMTLDVGYAASTAVFFGLFLATVAAQMRARTFHPYLYWAVIISTTTVGTTMSDYLNRSAGLGYVKGSFLLLVMLALVLALWRFTMGALSVDDITDRRVEAFYWAAILFSNTLGTSLGDFLADSSGLGFLGGAAVIAALLVAVAAAWRFSAASTSALFWAAFVLTRPLGATLGDLLTKPREQGGLDLGTGPSSLTLAIFLVACIAFSTVKGRWPGRVRVGESSRS